MLPPCSPASKTSLSLESGPSPTRQGAGRSRRCPSQPPDPARDLGYPDVTREPVCVAGLVDHGSLDADKGRRQQREEGQAISQSEILGDALIGQGVVGHRHGDPRCLGQADTVPFSYTIITLTAIPVRGEGAVCAGARSH